MPFVSSNDRAQIIHYCHFEVCRSMGISVKKQAHQIETFILASPLETVDVC